jgi:hypothetical protein
MMAHVGEISSPTRTQPKVVQQWPIITSSAPKQCVELFDSDVNAVLGERGEGDLKRWIFDMGACHTPFRERGNEASIRVPRMFKSHAWQQYD